MSRLGPCNPSPAGFSLELLGKKSWKATTWDDSPWKKNTAQLQKWILSQKGNHRLPNLAYETMSDDVERNQLISTGTLSKLYHVVKPLLGGLFKAIF